MSAGHQADAELARTLRRLGFGVSAVVFGFGGLFLIGETMSDPGGWQGVGLIAAWALPLAALVTFTRRRPDQAAWLFAALIAVVVALSIWFAINQTGWRSFEGKHGPIRTIVAFALAAALAVYGLERTMLAGLMLLVVGLVPIAISSIGHGSFSSLAAASVAPVITGVLYLASAASSRFGSAVHPARN